MILFTNLLSETRYVSKTAGINCAPPYTSWSTACDSLQKCFDYCSSGDTVYVDRGIYKETIYVHNKTLTVIGMDTDECIIDGSYINGLYENDVLIYIKEANLRINNFTLKKKRTSSSVNFYAFYYFNCQGTVNNCIIDSLYQAIGLTYSSTFTNNIIKKAITGINIVSHDGYSILIKNNIIHILNKNEDLGPIAIDNYVYGGSYKILNNILITNPVQGSGRGMEITANKKVEINNNLIYGFRNGINSYSINGVTDTTYIYNNVICKATTGIETGNLPKHYIIKNNIFASNRTGVYNYENAGEADYNLFYNNTYLQYQNLPYGQHDITADPMFVNDTTVTPTSNYDFRLQKYSPAINAGDPDIFDIDGSRSDIGMYGGPLGISYEYKDLAPKQVKGLSAVYLQEKNRVQLTYKKNTESDFEKYYIYKDTIANFTIDSTKRIGILTDTLFTDILDKGTKNVYYKVTAIDSTGNESRASTEISVTITNNDDAVITENYSYELFQNYPNPFNPSTTISYSLKEPAEVRIKLYTITGELLKTIIESSKNKGYNETQIDLSAYSSGIYLYRLEVTGAGKIPVFNDLKKMVYVK